MARCKSGLHEWSREEDAARCCNGYRRILLLGADVREAEQLGHGTLEGVAYGFAWVKVEPEQVVADRGGAMARIVSDVPCPVCGTPMRQIRRGATLARRGPGYVCPTDEAETVIDAGGQRRRIKNATHGLGIRVWQANELPNEKAEQVVADGTQ